MNVVTFPRFVGKSRDGSYRVGLRRRHAERTDLLVPGALCEILVFRHEDRARRTRRVHGVARPLNVRLTISDTHMT